MNIPSDPIILYSFINTMLRVEIDKAAHDLISIRDSIAAEKNSIPPAVLCVVCGISNAAYRRRDGVYVVPITALRN